MENKYKFNIGDEVITVDGRRGEITDICECERCQDRGFCEPVWIDDDGDEIFITDCDLRSNFSIYHKIGNYYFAPFEKDSLNKDIEYCESLLTKYRRMLKTIEELEDEERYRPYTRYFGEFAIGWTKDPELNKCFLLQQQNYANEKLRTRGYLFLNDVFDMLGFPRTQVGQIAGWVYDPENQIGDGFVDFGLFDAINHEDVVRDSNVWRLRFNAVGNILDRLEKE